MVYRHASLCRVTLVRVHHPFHNCRRRSCICNTPLYISIATTLLVGCLFSCISGMTGSGHFSDTFGFTFFEPTVTYSQNVVPWAETQKHCGVHAAYGPISSIPPWRTTRNFTNTNIGMVSAEQHVYEQEQGRHTLNFQVQLSNMSEHLVMKFMLQLLKLPKCPERSCGEKGVLSKI